MSVPEGHAVVHQIIRRIRGIGKSMLCAVRHPVLPKPHGGQHSGKQGQTALCRIHGVKDQLLVLLHVLVVCQGNPLHRGQQ